MKNGFYQVVRIEENNSSWEVNTENIDNESMLIEYLNKVGANAYKDEDGVWVKAESNSDARGWVIIADDLAIEDYKKSLQEL